MITMYRSANIAPGKTASTFAFAKEIAIYIKDKTGVEVSTAIPIGGNPNRIGRVARFDTSPRPASAAGDEQHPGIAPGLSRP